MLEPEHHSNDCNLWKAIIICTIPRSDVFLSTILFIRHSAGTSYKSSEISHIRKVRLLTYTQSVCYKYSFADCLQLQELH